ncbi:MAG: hypothetical protein CMC13_09885 [Flavobacteriaceae bacterium]|nr:hypothetical protein [Flavobacteriaceae bacterium]|tara:strand:+ start:39244 stop:39906 length:663 start_codon:yes stop_codon:yes gene_type:complete
MNNNTVNQSLIEIEENLKNLETARNQVDGVSKKSETLILEVTKLINKIQVLENEFSLEKSGLSNNITNEISKFKKSLKKESDVFIEKSKEVSEKHSNSTLNNIERLAVFQEKLGIVEKNISELDFEKGFVEIRERLQNILDQQESLSLDINKSFKGLEASTENTLYQLQKEQKVTNKHIFQSLDKQNKKLALLKKLLFVMVFLGIIGAVVGIIIVFIMFK